MILGVAKKPVCCLPNLVHSHYEPDEEECVTPSEAKLANYKAGSDSFWEVDQYKRTVKRQEDGLRLCSELMQLIQERADIEKQYSKNLKTWSKKWSDAIEKGPEYGTTEAAWRGCLNEAESVAEVHTGIRESLINNVQSQISAWKKENFHKPMVGPCKETKQLEDEFKKAQKPWAKRLAKVVDAKKKYHTACKLEKTATNQENNARSDSAVSSDQLKKLNDKADKCRKDVNTTKEKYESTLGELNSYNAKYMEDMEEVFRKSQAMEEKRLNFFKEMLYGIHHSLDLSDKPAIPQIYAQFKHTIDQADYSKDLLWWTQNHGTGMAMNWPQFEEYSPEMHDITNKKRKDGDVGVTLKRINTNRYSEEFPEYSTEFHAISRKEKKMQGGEGITLTAIQKNDSHTAPRAVEPPMPAHNNHAPQAISQPAPVVQRQMSYDPTLNPFEDEDEGEDLEAPLLQKSSTRDTEHVAQNISSACDKKSGRETLNPFEDDGRPKDRKPPRPNKKAKKTSASQNPFGEDDWDEYDNQGLQDDGSEGVAVRALYDYDGQEEDELTFKVGEVFVMLKEKDEQGWCTGRKDGRVGLFPDNYVENL